MLDVLLLIQEQGGTNIFLIVHNGSAAEAFRLASSFRNDSAVPRTKSKKIEKGGSRVRGEISVLERYGAWYECLGEVFLVAFALKDENPFLASTVLDGARSVLLNACQGGEITVARLVKRYAEVYLALEYVLLSQAAVDSSVGESNAPAFVPVHVMATSGACVSREGWTPTAPLSKMSGSGAAASSRACAPGWGDLKRFRSGWEERLENFAGWDVMLPPVSVSTFGSLVEADGEENAFCSVMAFPDEFLMPAFRPDRPKKSEAGEKEVRPLQLELPSGRRQNESSEEREGMAESEQIEKEQKDVKGVPTSLPHLAPLPAVAPPPSSTRVLHSRAPLPDARHDVTHAHLAVRVREVLDALWRDDKVSQMSVTGEVAFAVSSIEDTKDAQPSEEGHDKGSNSSFVFSVEHAGGDSVVFKHNPDLVRPLLEGDSSRSYELQVPAATFKGSVVPGVLSLYRRYVACLKYKQSTGITQPIRFQAKWNCVEGETSFAVQVLVNPVLREKMEPIVVSCEIAATQGKPQIEAQTGETQWVSESGQLQWTIAVFDQPARMMFRARVEGQGQPSPFSLRLSSKHVILSNIRTTLQPRYEQVIYTVDEVDEQFMSGRFEIQGSNTRAA